MSVEQRARQRRKDRRAAWGALITMTVLAVLDSIRDEFSTWCIAAIMLAGCWLVTEYQREWEAR